MKKYIYLILLLGACTGTDKSNSSNALPSEWLENATIYEVNVRQYTPEGTFAAFEKRLPQLKELGVDILWFMPIQPIGELNRKAVGDTFVQDLPDPDYITYWGSPYSISNYRETNPRYGTLDDFKRIIKKCHDMDIKVILDWVGNHTAWDHAWVTDHPEWYTHDSTGKITDPIGSDGKSWGWTDVADLNYENGDMRKAMIADMKFWVDECDLDGFRCDVAMEVPTDFWNQARPALEENKPLFMLAESETHKPDHFDAAFDAYYAWEMLHVYKKIYDGDVGAAEVLRVIKDKDSINGTKAFPMNFITNHDENSWNGTIDERLGSSWKCMALLSYTMRGMPLIYSGQEAGLNHRLSFFAKDQIKWDAEKHNEYFDFYKSLNHLRSQTAFGNSSPVSYELVGKNNGVLLASKGAEDDYKIVMNLSSSDQGIDELNIPNFENYTIAQSHNEVSGVLKGWGFLVLEKK